jgi:dolichyl-phosphate-mannose-protein mannosyltransferase
VYLASYAGWFAEHGLAPGGFLHLQREMASYHATLKATHAYQSSPFGWPVLHRPVAYYFDQRDGVVHHILALGNPALWWAFLPAFGGLAALALAPGRWAARALLAFLLAQYVPWLLPGRVLFLFYMTPEVPFMALGLTLVLRALPPRIRLAATTLAASAVVLAAALFLPVWIGYGVGSGWWRHLMLSGSWI